MTRSLDPALQAGLADREAETVREATPETEGTPEGVAALPISRRAYDLIVRHETGGRAYYERVYGGRPVWPKGASGVTIGFGYDLGFVGEDKARRDWDALPPADLAALLDVVGLRAGNTPAAELQRRVRELRRIVIGWDAAEAVFRASSLPEFTRLTAAHLPNCEALSPDSFGALVSLTFNRGPSYGKDGERYREMRALKAAMSDRNFAAIPAVLRAMKRIWVGSQIEAEMTRRRENEARLFEDGLANAARPEMLGAGGATAEVLTTTGPTDEDVWTDFTEDDVAEGVVEMLAETTYAAVRWAADADSPDYAHLGPGLPEGAVFEFTADDLARLCEANAFPVGSVPERMLFGLRGCAIVAGGGEFRDRVSLKDQRPDHRAARCVLGVWDRAGGRLAVFPGSTTPNASAVVRWRSKGDAGNLLATGFYRYIVGPHNGRPGCFLLRRTADEKWRVAVRRSSDDLAYETGDDVDVCAPGDNIHPTFFRSPDAFSSLGCQVVVGSADRAGAHVGPWADFRKAAGLTTGTGQAGTAYGYVLLTGAEARLSSRRGASDLRRLRFGSTGEAVGRLQAGLGLADPDGTFGPNTASAVHAWQQRAQQGRSDGVWSPALDAVSGFAALEPVR